MCIRDSCNSELNIRTINHTFKCSKHWSSCDCRFFNRCYSCTIMYNKVSTNLICTTLSNLCNNSSRSVSCFCKSSCACCTCGWNCCLYCSDSSSSTTTSNTNIKSLASYFECVTSTNKVKCAYTNVLCNIKTSRLNTNCKTTTSSYNTNKGSITSIMNTSTCTSSNF